MSKSFALALFIIVVVLAVALSMHHANGYSQLDELRAVNASIIYNGTYYNATFYVAATAQQQEQGYMNVSQPASPCSAYCGMLFPFAGYVQSCFWMKNTRFPIRQIWLEESSPGVYGITLIANATPYNTLNVSLINSKYILKIG